MSDTAPGALVARLRDAGCVFAEEEAALLLAQADADYLDADAVEVLVRRRIDAQPLEHVLGWAAFAGLRLAIAPGVFVPRHRSEFLVRQAAELARASGRAEHDVLDLCCGNGALGLALAADLTHATHGARSRVALHAADVDPVAVSCAADNGAALAAALRLPAVHTYCGNLFAPLPATLRGRVDVLLVNVPYVPTAALALMPREARDAEPPATRDGGADGLDVLRRVAAQAPTWLAPGGALFTETGLDQAESARGLLAAAGLVARVEVEDDEDDPAVVVIARRS